MDIRCDRRSASWRFPKGVARPTTTTDCCDCPRVTRRYFLQSTAAGLALPPLVAASALGKNDLAAASNRITVGLIGLGGMGSAHARVLAGNPAVQVLAVCDVDRWRRDNARTIVEELYASQDRSHHGVCQAYNDYRELLARPDVDGVLIATQDHWHALQSIDAARSGKDVYCEKPLTLTVQESKDVVAAIERYGCVFQTGLLQRSWSEFRLACQLVRSGRIGKVQHVYLSAHRPPNDEVPPPQPVPAGLDWDLWLGPAPFRPFNSLYHDYGKPQRSVPWYMVRDFGGGGITGDMVHDMDIVQWALDMDHSGPVEAIPPAAGKYPTLTFRYANGTLVHVDATKYPLPGAKTRLRGIFSDLFVGDAGWIEVGRRFLECFPPEIAQGSSAARAATVEGHHENWLECIRTRKHRCATPRSAHARPTPVTWATSPCGRGAHCHGPP